VGDILSASLINKQQEMKKCTFYFNCIIFVPLVRLAQVEQQLVFWMKIAGIRFNAVEQV